MCVSVVYDTWNVGGGRAYFPPSFVVLITGDGRQPQSKLLMCSHCLETHQDTDGVATFSVFSMMAWNRMLSIATDTSGHASLKPHNHHQSFNNPSNHKGKATFGPVFGSKIPRYVNKITHPYEEQ